MEAADLTDLLKQEGDFTLFAPSDKAFAGLSDSDLDLLKSKSAGPSLYWNEVQPLVLQVNIHTK